MAGVIGYLRVSTDEQAESHAGLDAQRAAILAEAHRRGWAAHEIRWIEDPGFSGKDLKRPGISQALEALRRGEAGTLVVAKLDRLTRSMSDFAPLLARAATEHWALMALDVNVDTSTPTGEAMAHVVATFAQLERRLIGERTREALRAKVARGERLGRPRVTDDAVVSRVRKMRAAGATLRSIADALDADQVKTSQGGRCWYPSSVRKLLQSAA
jgi:DNA invertase Pin-like site-specific DNA recombinase